MTAPNATEATKPEVAASGTVAPQTIAIAAPDEDTSAAASPAQAAAQQAPQPTQPKKVVPQDEFEFLAYMTGAMELTRLAPGRYVEVEGNTVHAFFRPSATQAAGVQRRVSFLRDQNQIHAGTGLSMQEAEFIVALGNKQWGGLKLLSDASNDDKFKLYMAAQTHHLRELVAQLEQGTISAEGKQRLVGYIANPQSVPAVKFQDSTALDGGTYRPPENITRIEAGKQVSVPVAAEIQEAMQALVARAVAHDATLRPAAVAQAPAPVVNVRAPHTSSAVPAAARSPLPTSRDAEVPVGAPRSTGAAARQRVNLVHDLATARAGGQQRRRDLVAALLGGTGRADNVEPAKVAPVSQKPANARGRTAARKSPQAAVPTPTKLSPA